jgi:hypothetical protein
MNLGLGFLFGLSISATLLALATATPPVLAEAPAVMPISDPYSDPTTIGLLKGGETCPKVAPSGFYGPGLGGTVWNVAGLGKLSVFDTNGCALGGAPFHEQCIVNGPGGAAVKSDGKEQTLFFVPARYHAFIEMSAHRQDCWMLRDKTREGKIVSKILFAADRERDNNSFKVGMDSLRHGDYLDAGAYLGLVYKYPDGGYLSGTIFDRGLGGNTDHVLAAYLMGRSATHGYYPAQLRLSAMYRNGVGVQPDTRAARYWLSQARRNPNKTYSPEDLIVDGPTRP